MKKGLLLVLVIALFSVLFLLTGCEEKITIVGEWTYPGTTYTYVFNEDGTGSYFGKNFTYTLSGDKISMQYEGDTLPFETTYELTATTLNVRDSLGNDTIYNRTK